MPKLTYSADGKMDIGDHTISDLRVKNLSEIAAYDISEDGNSVTHFVTFKNGGTVSVVWKDNGKSAEIDSKSLTQTVADDPENEKGIIFTFAIPKK